MQDGDSKEIAISSTRVLLAAASFLAIYIDPTEPSRFARIAYSLLTLYLFYSVAALVIVIWSNSKGALPYFYGMDVMWPVVISIFTEGPNTPFFLFFLFALLSSGYRWGMKRSLQTASLFVLIFLLEASALHRTRIAQYLQLASDPNRLMMRSVYLMILGFLIGFFAEEERDLKDKMDLSLRLLNQVSAESGLMVSGVAALAILGDALDARFVGCFYRRQRSEKSLLFLVNTENRSLTTLQLREEETSQYLRFREELFVMKRDGRKAQLGVLTGQQWRRFAWRIVSPLPRLNEFSYRSLMSCSFDFGEQWNCKVLVLDPKKLTSVRNLMLLKYAIRQALPSLYNVYLLEELRDRASQIERTRLARALHDSTLQALSGIRMQLEAIRLTPRFPANYRHQLMHIEQQLREQAVELRALMTGKDLESFDCESLPRRMHEIVRKIAREGTVRTQFVWDGKQLHLSNLKCRELALATQEAVANVVKHSDAENVVVVLKSDGPDCCMTIADDGKGFPQEGTYNLDELDDEGWGPLVVKERARNIGADLRLTSSREMGTTIVISVRQDNQ